MLQLHASEALYKPTWSSLPKQYEKNHHKHIAQPATCVDLSTACICICACTCALVQESITIHMPHEEGRLTMTTSKWHKKGVHATFQCMALVITKGIGHWEAAQNHRLCPYRGMYKTIRVQQQCSMAFHSSAFYWESQHTCHIQSALKP